jgi:RNA polymerase primary sigma factor
MRPLLITQSITQRSTPSVDRYLQEIGKLELVSAETEVLLSQRIRSGDEEALHQLTRANLRFVVSVAKQYQYQGLSLNDLISEGNIGLITAARRFDETRGFKFISYAVWWIRQSIIQAIATKGRMVRLPQNKSSLALQISKQYAALEQDLERAPSAEELAALMGLSPEEIEAAGASTGAHTSLDAPLSEGVEGTFLDLLEGMMDNPDQDAVQHDSLSTDIQRSLHSLSPAEKEVICCYYGIGMPHPFSLQEIGLQFNLSTERIRQIRQRALKKLRDPKKLQLLQQYDFG